MSNTTEVRRLSACPAELRVERVTRKDGDVDTFIKGYGAVFEQYSRPFWDEWVEIISSRAFDDTDMSDVVMVVDHAREVSSVLARSKDGNGTLEITVDEKGVAFRFLVPNTSKGRDIVTLVERGDIRECSFAFYVGSDRWLYDVEVDGEKYDVRRIESVTKLVDLSIVVNGQYPQTSVSVEERQTINNSRKATRSPVKKPGMSYRLAKAIVDTLN